MSLIRRIITRENSTAHFVQPIRYHFMTPIRDTSGIDSSQRLRFVTAICRPRVVGLPSCESKGGVTRLSFSRGRGQPIGTSLKRCLGWKTHGQRVSKLLTGEDFREEVVVPAGDLHFASQTFFERMMLESRDGEAS